MIDAKEFWALALTQPRPVHVFLKHVAAAPDPEDEFRRLTTDLPNGFFAGLASEIRLEFARSAETANA
jgi:hypothetical protein